MTPEEAQDKVDQAWQAAVDARGSLLQAVGEAWERRASEIVMQAVSGQPAVTKSMEIATLAVLKANLATAIADAKQSVGSVFDDATDINTLAAKARINSSGSVRVDIQKPTELLAVNLHGLLSKAGYRLDALKNPGGNYSHDSFTASDIALGIHVQENAFSAAAENLGKARITLADARHEAESGEAAALWNSI